jgi:hypothetical protein
MRPGSLFLLVAVAACSGGAGSPGTGASSDLQGDGGAGHGVPVCLGDTSPLVLDRGRPFAAVRVGAAASPYEGAFLVDLATTQSTIDLSAFAAPGPTATGCDPSLDASLTTCAGVAEAVEAYRLAPGASLVLGPRASPSAVVFVKRTPPVAQRCGGIGTWSAPAAQIGVSFFVDLGVIVFDPFASRVWVRQGTWTACWVGRPVPWQLAHWPLLGEGHVRGGSGQRLAVTEVIAPAAA